MKIRYLFIMLIINFYSGFNALHASDNDLIAETIKFSIKRTAERHHFNYMLEDAAKHAAKYDFFQFTFDYLEDKGLEANSDLWQRYQETIKQQYINSPESARKKLKEWARKAFYAFFKLRPGSVTRADSFSKTASHCLTYKD